MVGRRERHRFDVQLAVNDEYASKLSPIATKADKAFEDEHGTDLDHGEADPSDYQPWTGSVVARFEVAS